MNITALHTFLTIIETGSLIRASEKLCVTQSTVTARLKNLEQEIGQTLLNRQKSGTTLTPAGTRLLPYARIMSGFWRQAKFETGLPAGLSSTCTFGCNRELWHGPGRVLFNCLEEKHAEIAISVFQGSSQDLDKWINEGSIDLSVTFEAVAKGSQTIHPLPEEKLVLHSSQADTGIFQNPNYVFVDHGSEYRRQHAEYYHEAGISRLQFDSSWWAMQYLLENIGSAYLPVALADKYVQQKKLHIVHEAPTFKRKKYLIVNDLSAENWPWFDSVIQQLQSEKNI